MTARVDAKHDKLAGTTFRPGTVEDVPALLQMMDRATEWLVETGRPGQWGTEKQSDKPRRIKQATDMAESGGLWVVVNESDISDQADADAAHIKRATGVIGALCVGQAMPYVKPATEPELYVKLLLTDRTWAGCGLGKVLLNKARELAREAAVDLLRVDCYAGDDGKLVKYYESQGFERTEAFVEQGWPGQVLVEHLNKAAE